MSNVESWCTVELTSDQSHNRKQRKHHPEQFNSTVFQAGAQTSTGQSGRLTSFNTSQPKLAQKKHFPAKHDHTFQI
ncbi:protein SPATA45 homolog [Bolinopsis microptera]|uniref:protein SPATA45 homolog n=1 Tax=Bolinopsis microptera TaxID=2820187 RepID=UPI003079B390